MDNYFALDIPAFSTDASFRYPQGVERTIRIKEQELDAVVTSIY